jgi:hypothetical protein
MIGGVEYWASGWTKERANGDKWISLSFKVKEQRNGSQGAPMQRGRFDDDSDVPFISSDAAMEWRVG